MSVTLAGFDLPNPAIPHVAAPTGPGGMASGTYQYKYSWRTRFGETLASPATIAAVTDGACALSQIPLYDNAAFRRIYRTQVGGSVFFLLHEIDDAVTTSYVDISPDSALTTPEPIANTASSVEVARGYVQLANQLMRTCADVTATGVDRATAALIGENEVTFVSGPVNSGVALPPINTDRVGLCVCVNNVNPIDSIQVYPYESTTSINGGFPGTPYTLLAGFTLNLIVRSATQWYFSQSLTAGVSGPPSGASGGSLTGAYPNPGLNATGVIAGTYGTATDSAVVTVGVDGRVTAASQTPIVITPTGVVAGTYTKVDVTADGRVTNGALLTVADVPNPIGDITGTYAATVVSTLQGQPIRMVGGSQICIIGNNAVASGVGNVLVGASAGAAVTTNLRNTCIGAYAGELLTGNDNVMIGWNAGSTSTIGSNLLCLQGISSSPTVSNEITIGNPTHNRVRFGAVTVLPVFSDNTAALMGGLSAGFLYRTAIGQVMIVY